MRKMMMLALMLAIAALMMAAAPAMAQGNHNHNDDNNKNNDDNHFVRNFDRFDDNRFDRFDNDDDFCDFFDCNFDRFDHFDNGFDNGFQDFEQEADSGDVAQSFQVINTGENANQCVGITGNANTGNAQNQIGLIQYGSDADEFEFDDTGANLTVTGNSTTTCDQQVNQAATAG